MESHKQKLKHLGHALHDHVAPQFFISKMQLEILIDALAEDALPPEQQQVLLKSWRALVAGYNNLRGLMHLLETGEEVDPAAFFPTLTEVCATFAGVLPLPRFTYTLLQDLPPNVQLQVEKSKKLGICVAELLINALKHTKNARVQLQVSLEENEVCVQVNTISLPLQPVLFAAEKAEGKKPKGGIGLKLMEERLKEWGGRLLIEEGYGHNWSNRVYLPLTALEDEN